VKHDSAHLLIPPDVQSPDVLRRSLTVHVKAGGGPCPVKDDAIGMRAKRQRVQLTIAGDLLAKQPSGWLTDWGTRLESQHCVETGDGMKVATRVAESVPVDPGMAFRLLRPDDWRTGKVDLGPQTRLRVLSPIWRVPGMGMMTGPTSVTGNDQHLIVTSQSTENLAGYERVFYAVVPRAGVAGYTIHVTATERYSMGAAVEHPSQPTVDFLKFPAEAAFFRLFYESWQNGFSALIVGARTPAALERQSEILEASGESASCESLKHELCVAVPKEVAVTPMIEVTVNGKEVLVTNPATVESALATAGEQDPKSILPRLVVNKPWNGRLTVVSFDRADAGILRLRLGGGEVISWK